MESVTVTPLRMKMTMMEKMAVNCQAGDTPGEPVSCGMLGSVSACMDAVSREGTFAVL